MELIADSLDMLIDAIIFGISISYRKADAEITPIFMSIMQSLQQTNLSVNISMHNNLGTNNLKNVLSRLTFKIS